MTHYTKFGGGFRRRFYLPHRKATPFQEEGAVRYEALELVSFYFLSKQALHSVRNTCLEFSLDEKMLARC